MSEDDFAKLTEIGPIAITVAEAINRLSDLSRSLSDKASRHDRLVRAMDTDKVKGCKVDIQTSYGAGIMATSLPKELQMQIVKIIRDYYRDDALRLFEEIQKLKEEL